MDDQFPENLPGHRTRQVTLRVAGLQLSVLPTVCGWSRLYLRTTQRSIRQHLRLTCRAHPASSVSSLSSRYANVVRFLNNRQIFILRLHLTVKKPLGHESNEKRSGPERRILNGSFSSDASDSISTVWSHPIGADGIIAVAQRASVSRHLAVESEMQSTTSVSMATSAHCRDPSDRIFCCRIHLLNSLG